MEGWMEEDGRGVEVRWEKGVGGERQGEAAVRIKNKQINNKKEKEKQLAKNYNFAIRFLFRNVILHLFAGCMCVGMCVYLHVEVRSQLNRNQFSPSTPCILASKRRSLDLTATASALWTILLAPSSSFLIWLFYNARNLN